MHRVLYSGFRFSHHNEGSGYDGIVKDPKHYVCGNLLLWGDRAESSFLRKLNFLLVDLVTIFKSVGYSTVHYFYPENTCYFSPLLLKFLGKEIVYTLHLDEKLLLSRPRTPFGWLKRLCFRHADLIVTLSKHQAVKLQSVFPHKRISFVPHGLAMDAAVPEDSVLHERVLEAKVAVVGSNYRDFELLEQIVKSRSSRRVTFHLVGMNEAVRQRFSGLPGVVCHSRLSPSEYSDLLGSCQLMALPLTFATANNALLEAHKFYLPSLCSDVPGAVDYATSSTVFFRDAGAFWDAFDDFAGIDILAYREICLQTHQEGIEKFSWDTIRAEIADLYQRHSGC